jgi:hypothetical protein
MRTHLHRWLPTVIAVVALFVALDGPATAAKKINGKAILKGTVASKQLKDLSVQGADVANGTLTGDHVADGSLAGSDVQDGSLAGADLQDGSVTSQDVADGSVTGADVKDASVGAADLADGSVGKTELQDASVTGLAFDASGTQQIDFGTIAAQTCASAPILIPLAEIADGNLSDDVMVATPDAFFAGNFSYTVKTEGSQIPYIRMCNIGATAADPDFGGGTKAWRWVAIDIR